MRWRIPYQTMEPTGEAPRRAVAAGRAAHLRRTIDRAVMRTCWLGSLLLAYLCLASSALSYRRYYRSDGDGWFWLALALFVVYFMADGSALAFGRIVLKQRALPAGTALPDPVWLGFRDTAAPKRRTRGSATGQLSTFVPLIYLGAALAYAYALAKRDVDCLPAAASGFIPLVLLIRVATGYGARMKADRLAVFQAVTERAGLAASQQSAALLLTSDGICEPTGETTSWRTVTRYWLERSSDSDWQLSAVTKPRPFTWKNGGWLAAVLIAVYAVEVGAEASTLAAGASRFGGRADVIASALTLTLLLAVLLVAVALRREHGAEKTLAVTLPRLGAEQAETLRAVLDRANKEES